MKIVIVPDWLSASLKKGLINYSTLLDIDKLLSILSKRDVAFYFYIQAKARDYFPKAFKCFMSQRLYGDNHIDQLPPPPNEINALIDTVICFDHPINNLCDLLSATAEVPGTLIPIATEEQRVSSEFVDFEVLFEESNIFFVRIKSLDSANICESMLDTMDCFLTALTAVRPLSEVASTTLFKEYVNLSYRKLIAA